MLRMLVSAQRPGAKEAIEHEGFFSNVGVGIFVATNAIVSSWILFADVRALIRSLSESTSHNLHGYKNTMSSTVHLAQRHLA
jgi:hypothetical protein